MVSLTLDRLSRQLLSIERQHQKLNAEIEAARLELNALVAARYDGQRTPNQLRQLRHCRELLTAFAA